MSEETQVAVPEGIRAFDAEGREVRVPREQWQNEVLPGMLQQAWDQPDQLYMLIVNSLNDGFLSEVSDAARHLYETDTVPARGTCMWAIVLIQTGRLVEAEMVLTGFGERHGEDASVLVNLAKVYAAKGEQARAEAALDRALALEPNHENGLGWFASMARERGGDQGAARALEQMRANPASWRAQLWLARPELDSGRLDAARALYEEALSRAPRPVPAEFLMQMSGDLGGRGHLRELLELTGPHFVPEVHGLPVGNNLIKASVDTGNLDAAAAILSTLAPFNRPDWRNPLAFWEQEIAKRRGGGGAGPSTAAAGQPQQVQIGMLRVDGPVWLPPGSPARAIFGEKPASAASVTFLGGTAEAPEGSSDEPTPEQRETADHLGRLTRSLPLFLAEQTDLRTAAIGRAMLPWAVVPAAGTGGHPGGFVVAAAQWPDATAVQAVQDPANRSDYVVTVHIDAEVEPWEASLVFLRTSDGARIGELSAEFGPDELEPALEDLADEVVDLLTALGPESEAPNYALPDNFPAYLGQLEQLLALRCVTVEGGPGQALSGERLLLEGAFALEQEAPDNVAVRLLLLETVGAMQRNRPEIAAEYRPRLEQVVQEHPLAAVDAVFASM